MTKKEDRQKVVRQKGSRGWRMESTGISQKGSRRRRMESKVKVSEKMEDEGEGRRGLDG